MVEIVRSIVSAKIPPICSFAKSDRRSAGLENGFESGGLNAFRGRSKLQSFWAGLLASRLIASLLYSSEQSLITVARPHGILTRFPILPISWGTQMLSNTKNNS
jgi:hypothetical protein